jgi:hypothetical protein
LIIGNDIELKQKDLNYNLFDVLADHIMEDLEITQDEIFLADNLCDILSFLDQNC